MVSWCILLQVKGFVLFNRIVLPYYGVSCQNWHIFFESKIIRKIAEYYLNYLFLYANMHITSKRKENMCMKIIDLLKEKEALVKAVTDNRYNNFPQVAEGDTESERKKFREFQQNTKRFNEICDELNMAFCKTKISVPFYGDISLATALSYFRARTLELDSFHSISELEELLISDADFKFEAMNRVCLGSAISFDDEDDNDGSPVILNSGMNLPFGLPAPTKRKIDKEFMRNSYNELKVAIMKAIVETDL